MLLNKLLVSFIIISITACSTTRTGGGEPVANKPGNSAMPVKAAYSGAPAIIYKTTKDYKDKVPVTLSDDKTKIISYPSPMDVFYNGKLALPTQLENGYLLDNRGISVNSAFTKYTYEEYSKLKTAPDMPALFTSIIDNNPFQEIYNCGNRYRFKDEVSELNADIKSGKLKEYIKIK